MFYWCYFPGATNYNAPPPTPPKPRYGHGQVPPSYTQQPPVVRNYAGNFPWVPDPFLLTRVPLPRGAPISRPNPPFPQPHPSYWIGTYMIHIHVYVTHIMTRYSTENHPPPLLLPPVCSPLQIPPPTPPPMLFQ